MLNVVYFTITIKDHRGSPRFLQMALSLKVKDKISMDNLHRYDPLWYAHLFTLLSRVRYEEVNTLQGREALTHKALLMMDNMSQDTRHKTQDTRHKTQDKSGSRSGLF